MQITGKTKLLGVIGDPISHSLSPVMQNAAIAYLGVDYLYVPFLVRELEIAVRGLAALGIAGFNITIPHKQAILPLLMEVTPIAGLVGAVNTVWWNGYGWSGTNTDVEGFVAPLQTFNPCSEAVVLGCGGAARAVVVGCHQLNCQRIHVVGRRAEKLVEFQKSWQGTAIGDCLQTYLWSELPRLLPHADLIINTTPLGMGADADQSPLTAEDRLKQGAIAYDLIYTPHTTKFLQQARNQGVQIINGMEMLVQQGAASLSIWLGQPAPVEVMRQSITEVLYSPQN